MISPARNEGTDDEGYDSRRTVAEESSEDDTGTTSFSITSSDVSSAVDSLQMDGLSIRSEPGSGFCMLNWRSEMTPGAVSALYISI